jgi:hypothetical protein
VLAGSFLRKREIVLDRELLTNARELTRIVVHEVFHFVWRRLGNSTRRDWEHLLRNELAANVGGEAGWSAQWRKTELRARDIRQRTRRWREYVCEGFCDTAAWLFTGQHREMTLDPANRKPRRRWFSQMLHRRLHELPI